MELKTIQQIVKEAIAKAGRRITQDDCSVPMASQEVTLKGTYEYLQHIQTWKIFFSYPVQGDKSRRGKVDFKIETPPNKSEDEVRAEVFRQIRQQLGGK